MQSLSLRFLFRLRKRVSQLWALFVRDLLVHDSVHVWYEWTE